MPILPPFALALNLLQVSVDLLLEWFSQGVYALLLPYAKDHPLVKVHDHFDLNPLEQACAGFHHGQGPGAPPTHPVPRLVRALLVGYLFNWSLRDLEWHIRFNLVIKWFVGYAVYEPGPDHSTLERFYQWVDAYQHRAYFDTVLRQIDADFPDQRRQAQVGDTFALRANAAKESLIRLIRHTCQRLLAAVAAADPEVQAAVRAQLDLNALFGATDEQREYQLDAAGRTARLQTTVIAALACARQVRAALDLDAPAPLVPVAHPSVSLWLDCLDKVLADEVEITRDAQGAITAVAELPDGKQGSYRLGSATDPDATYRVHGKDKVDFGYNIQVTATQDFIREIQADTGAQPDPVSIPEVLTAQHEHHGFFPPKLIYDKAAGTGKTHAEVERATAGQTQLVAPLIDHTKSAERFTPEDFTLSPDGQSLTCPKGQTTTTAYRSRSGEGRNFRFPAGRCQGCKFCAKCRGDKVPAEHMRQVFISDHRSTAAQARTYAQTPEFKADMKLRPGIERIISNLTNYHGARRARRRGQDKADFQAKMSGTVFNLRQWLRKLAARADQASPAAAGA
ncbi:MAG TPA: transposase [Anaerolineales bacterium]|nr:transposase [Anaerolineales bacterium]